MKTPYSFVVLRYVHDIVSGEFVNVGVALYAPAVKYVRARCNLRYGRLSKMFTDVDGDHFRSLVRHIESRIEALGDRLESELLLDRVPSDIVQIVKGVLPPDDSSLQWSEAGGGQTGDPTATLEHLYGRLVERYEERRPRRDEGDIWRVYRQELAVRNVLSHLRPKTIATSDYSYEFDHSWKNQQWHVYEPVSFDLLEASSILDKANRWLGRATTLQDSTDKFKLTMLLGEPALKKLRPAYTKAENILNKIPVEKELVRENEAAEFSHELADAILADKDG